MRISVTDGFELPLPPGHRFPVAKYGMLRRRLREGGAVPPESFLVPEAASERELGLVHESAYVRRVLEGRLDAAEVRRIGLPWSPALVERSLRSVGATVATCWAASEDGLAASLAGGTHHAFADHGEGYCVFNDVAVAARVMQLEGRVRTVLVVDCDVHQGNGTAAIFRTDPSVFTFSLHGAGNFPFRKETSDLDVALDDGATDDAYLAALTGGLEAALERSRPHLVVYVAGADPYAGDRLGRLALSKEGLAVRDRTVLQRCRSLGLPVAIVLGGGYADPIEDTVDIHARTIALAAAMNGGRAGRTDNKESSQ